MREEEKVQVHGGGIDVLSEDERATVFQYADFNVLALCQLASKLCGRQYIAFATLPRYQHALFPLFNEQVLSPTLSY